MKKNIVNFCGYIAAIIFALSPIILIIIWATETEKIVAPILIIILALCAIPILIESTKKEK